MLLYVKPQIIIQKRRVHEHMYVKRQGRGIQLVRDRLGDYKTTLGVI